MAGVETGEDCKICKLVDIIRKYGAVLGRESLFFDRMSNDENFKNQIINALHVQFDQAEQRLL